MIYILLYVLYTRIHMYMYIVCICICSSVYHDEEATVCFLGQSQGSWVQIPGSPDLPFGKRYLSSQQSSVSYSVKIVLHRKSCQYIKIQSPWKLGQYGQATLALNVDHDSHCQLARFPRGG